MYVASVLVPVAFIHVVPFVDCCQLYVGATSPLAAAVDVNGMGVSPEQMVWLEPILPEVAAGMILIVTVSEYAVVLQASDARRR